ncbi:MAG: recombinase zinc beta ribbon domain-containing protein [Elusimicrobia bacterium]|nr:recombinase zinc beta ribbon domain-containing protein [Elusimicrobiota bacterium]
MLTNPAYTGCMIVENKLMPGTHPAIVNDDNFNWAQELLKARTVVPGRLAQSPNFLVGIVRCGKCGRPMTTMKGTSHLKRRYYYYACAGRLRSGSCDMRYIQARPLEEAILREIRAIAGEPKVIDEYLAQHLAENQSASGGLLAERVSVQKQLEGAVKTKENRVRWLVENIPAKPVADEVSAEIQAQIASIAGLRRRLNEIDGRLRSIASDNAKSDNLASLLRDFAAHFDTWTQGKKRSLIKSMVREVKVTAEGDVEVVFDVPLTADLVDQMRAKIEAPPDEKPFASVPLELIGGSQPGSPLYPKNLRAQDSNLKPCR